MRKISILVLLVILVTLLTGFSIFKKKDAGIGTLIVYTNQMTDGTGLRLRNLVKDADFDFEVEFVSLAGQNLKNRLIAEKEAPLADVALGGSIIEHLELKEQGVTKPYFPSWLDLVDDVYKDEEGYYSPWAIEPLFLVYNKAYYTDNPEEVSSTKKLAPKNYIDLAENFTGEYNVFKPSGGTGSTIYASILLDYQDEGGDAGISAEGWELLGKLINGGELDRGLWQQNLAGSEKPIAMTWAGAVIEIEEAYGIELGIVIPEEGVPVVVSQIALIDSGDEARMAAAAEFIEWWGKTETQVKRSQISGQAPANKEAWQLVDEKVKKISNVKAKPMDWQLIADNISIWRRKIELDVIEN